MLSRLNLSERFNAIPKSKITGKLKFKILFESERR